MTANRPAGTVPEFFEWPGSPFGRENLTGLWHHDSFESLAQYAFELLFGSRGFVLHNLPLLIVPAAVVVVWRALPRRRVDVVCTAGCCVATWILYAALSNNFSGLCRSVRWLLPLLGPAFYLLALGMRVESRLRLELAILAVFGAAGTAAAWPFGPWSIEFVPCFWPSTGVGVATWLLLIGLRHLTNGRSQPKHSPMTRDGDVKPISPEYRGHELRARRSFSTAFGQFASPFAAVVTLLIATSPILPLVWDEGNALNRADGILDWLGDVRDQGAVAFSEAEVARHWHYTVEVEGHPALYGIVIAFGQWLAGSWMAPLMAARLGPMMLFSVAAGAMFYRLRREYSLAAALAAVVALLTMPRLFAHAHFASCDGPLTSCWVLAWALFPAADGAIRRDAPQTEFATGVRALIWGVAVGAAMSCKFTGWLAPLPFIAYGLVYGNRQTAKTLALGLLAAVGAFWLTNPRLWHHPVGGMQRFFDMNLQRAGTGFDIATLFLGTVYNQVSGLPWYNTLVWTGITVPIGTLLLAVVGIIGTLRRWAADGQSVLLLLNWLTLVVVRALPGAPVHDAERLILPSFAFLAALAGVGCHFLVERHRGRCLRHVERHGGHSLQSAERHRGRFLKVAIAMVFLGSASSLGWYAPQWLSYYNLLIGGLRGADRAGMEATYYWDALDSEVLDWLHEHTSEDEKIDFGRPSAENLAFAQRWGVLRRGWRPEEPGQYRWYVIQHRQTFWTPGDRWLVEHETPTFAKTIRPPAWDFGPWRLDVPLIEVFSFEQHRRAKTQENHPSASCGRARGPGCGARSTRPEC